MKTFCITCPELPESKETAKRHFESKGLPVNFVDGIHAESFGIMAWRSYKVNYPELGEFIAMKHVGLTLSHYMVWNICNHIDEDYFLILEDDAKFPFNWQERLQQALTDVPKDWDILLIGSANTKDKPREKMCGDVWEVKYPFTTHAYLLRKKAVAPLLALCRDAAMPIDTLLILKAYPHLRVYTVLPRIVDQRGTVLDD